MRMRAEVTVPSCLHVGSGPEPLVAAWTAFTVRLSWLWLGVTPSTTRQPPAARHDYLTTEAIAKLEPPDLPNTPVFVQLFEQMDLMERSSTH